MEATTANRTTRLRRDVACLFIFCRLDATHRIDAVALQDDVVTAGLCDVMIAKTCRGVEHLGTCLHSRNIVLYV